MNCKWLYFFIPKSHTKTSYNNNTRSVCIYMVYMGYTSISICIILTTQRVYIFFNFIFSLFMIFSLAFSWLFLAKMAFFGFPL